MKKTKTKGKPKPQSDALLFLDGDVGAVQAELAADDDDWEDEDEETYPGYLLGHDDLKPEFQFDAVDDSLYNEYIKWLEDQNLDELTDDWWYDFIFEKFGQAAFIDPDQATYLYGETIIGTEAGVESTVASDVKAPETEGKVTGTGQSYTGGTGYSYKANCSGPHDGSDLDLVFKIGDVVFSGSKAANLDMDYEPDVVLDFADSYSLGKDPDKFVLTGPEQFRALNVLVPRPKEPGALIKFKWPDQGIPPVGAPFWLALWVRIKELLIDRHGKLEGRVTLCCVGGHGRTGTGLSSLLICLGGYGAHEAILQIRDDYCEEAVESKKQLEYLENLEKEMAAAFADEEVREIARSQVTRPRFEAAKRIIEAKAAKAAEEKKPAAPTSGGANYHKTYRYVQGHKTDCAAHYGEACDKDCGPSAQAAVQSTATGQKVSCTCKKYEHLGCWDGCPDYPKELRIHNWGYYG